MLRFSATRLLSRAAAVRAGSASSARAAAAACATVCATATAGIVAFSEPRGNELQFQAIRNLRQKLDTGRVPLVGIGIQLADPTSTDALCDCSDFLWFDQEHTPLSPEMLKWHMMVAHGRGCPVIVRIPGPNVVSGDARPWGTYIKHALDSNADGIVVPQIRSAADVRSIVSDCRYPTGQARSAPYSEPEPESAARLRRGFGPTTPMNYGRIPLQRYIDDADASVFVAVMIETTEALADIEGICATPGLDCVVIGTNDLSGAMGVPYEGNHPRVQGAVDKIIDAAQRHGKYVMFSTRDAKLAAKLAAKGVQILHVGSDVLAAVSYQSKLVSEIKSGATTAAK